MNYSIEPYPVFRIFLRYSGLATSNVKFSIATPKDPGRSLERSPRLFASIPSRYVACHAVPLKFLRINQPGSAGVIEANILAFKPIACAPRLFRSMTLFISRQARTDAKYGVRKKRPVIGITSVRRDVYGREDEKRLPRHWTYSCITDCQNILNIAEQDVSEPRNTETSQQTNNRGNDFADR